VAPVCEREIFAGDAGVEGEIEKGNAFESAPRLVTSIFTVPGVATSDSGMAAINSVELTNVVANCETVGVPEGGDGGTIQSTTEPVTKFVPVTVSVTPGGLHAGADAIEEP
jgi:hypothetical protein